MPLVLSQIKIFAITFAKIFIYTSRRILGHFFKYLNPRECIRTTIRKCGAYCVATFTSLRFSLT